MWRLIFYRLECHSELAPPLVVIYFFYFFIIFVIRVKSKNKNKNNIPRCNKPNPILTMFPHLIASNITTGFHGVELGGRRFRFKGRNTNILGNTRNNNNMAAAAANHSIRREREDYNAPSTSTLTSTSTSHAESRLAHKEWCTRYTESMCEDCEYVFTGIRTDHMLYGWLWLRVFCG